MTFRDLVQLVEAASKEPKTPLAVYRKAKKLGKRLPELESILFNDLKIAYDYAKNIVKTKWPEYEDYLLKHYDTDTDHYALWYTHNVLKDRWPEVEPYVLKNEATAEAYATGIYASSQREKKQDPRWYEAEPLIIQNPHRALRYARDVIKGRWPEAEEIILSYPKSKEDYINFLKTIKYSDLEESFKLR